jgi:hypothetical protein
VLAAGELGYSINEAIDRIEIRMGETLRGSVDGRMMLRSQGVTYSPTFSRDIEEAALDFEQTYFSGRTGAVTLEGREATEFWSKKVELGRAAGADIGKWFRARTFDAVSGSMAEAIFSKRAFYDVWSGYQAETDLLGVVREAEWAGIGSNEVTSTIKRMAVLAACVMENPEVWAAVLALAKNLPAVGRVDGAQAAAIITGVIPETDLAGTFGKALERVAELEQEINAAEIVVVRTPDGSHNLIKGGKVVDKLRGKSQDGAEVLEYECTFLVFAETLCQAFGDRSCEGAKAA